MERIVKPLLAWYAENKRTLPWRDKGNPYYTWVSEIMLQQTRVEAVKPYFERFIRELPNIRALADCPQDRLFKLWEGLGYYTRVANLKTAACQVVDNFAGELPHTQEELLTLQGIGEYTAGAIASIAFGQPVPAVDGNVLRVVARLKEITDDIRQPKSKRLVRETLQEILPPGQAGDFNQSLMELGALVCMPKKQAKCIECPLEKFCRSRQDGIWEELPIKAAPKERPIENRTILLIQDGEATALRKRPPKGLLAGLYEPFNEQGVMDRDQALAFVRERGLEPLFIEELGEARHVFTHVVWQMIGYRIRVAALEDSKDPSLFFMPRNRVQKDIAVPSAFRAYVDRM